MAKGQQKSNREAKKPKKTPADRAKEAAQLTAFSQMARPDAKNGGRKP